jgi:hypothetical protein
VQKAGSMISNLRRTGKPTGPLASLQAGAPAAAAARGMGTADTWQYRVNVWCTEVQPYSKGMLRCLQGHQGSSTHNTRQSAHRVPL